MALKRKITKAAFDALSDALKAEYKSNPMNTDEYFLDVDDASEITRARDREKARADDLQEKLTAAGSEITTLKTDLTAAKKAQNNPDIAELERSWSDKVAKLEKKHADAMGKKDSFLTTQLVDGEAMRIAQKISTAPAVILPHIKARLRAELDGDTPITRVLGPDGKPSAASIDELASEFVANKDFSSIMIASKASGSSASTGKLPPAGSAKPGGNEPPDLTALKPKDLAAGLAERVEARRAAAQARS